MNKHLLDQKLRSIEHYNSELKKLSEAMGVVKDVKNEIIASLAEFFPFESGDTILFTDWDARMVKIEKFSHVSESTSNAEGFVFVVNVFEQDYKIGFKTSSLTESYSLSKINSAKKI